MEQLTEKELDTIKKFTDEHGERVAAEKLGVGVDSLLRVLARRPNVRPGTVALLQRSLGRLGLVGTVEVG